MIAGGAIMIIGVIIQISCVYGQKAIAQFIVGRIITGVGNGIVRVPLPSIESSLTEIEHFHHPNLPSRVQPEYQPWSAHLYRRGYNCIWNIDRILDRLWRIIQYK